MSNFTYHNSQLYAENVSLNAIAEQFSTPCYVYSKKTIEQNWHEYASKIKHVFYAVKANSNLSILAILAKLGSGFDTVSGGEIQRVLLAGGKPNKIVFSGVGKTAAELTMAIDLEIHSINIESIAELLRIQEIASQRKKIVNIALRINPDVTANTHPYISTGSKHNKFGIDFSNAVEIFTLASNLENIKIQGISCHIGSQITSLEPFLQAIDQLLIIIDQLAKENIYIKIINIGGGLGITYKDETPPTATEYLDAILNKLSSRDLEIHLEPGRSIIANAGILLTKVEYVKTTGDNHFAIVDAGMNDLIRPALYDSYHNIIPVKQNPVDIKTTNYSIVGPVCESSDFLAKNRQLNLKSGDLLAVETCGAYGFSMSSNYNTRPKCAEILVDNDKATIICRRETIEQVLSNELPINVD